MPTWLPRAILPVVFVLFMAKTATANFLTHSFDSPSGEYTFQIRETEENSPNDCFLDLIRKADGKVIKTLHWPQVRHARVSWNPSGTLLALLWEQSDCRKYHEISLFRVFPSGLREIPLFPLLSFRKMLPKHDPLRKLDPYYQDIHLSKWIDDTRFVCEITRVFRLSFPSGTAIAGRNLTPQGFLGVSYEAVVQCGDFHASILSLRHTEYKNSKRVKKNAK